MSRGAAAAAAADAPVAAPVDAVVAAAAPRPALPPNNASLETFGGPTSISFDAASNEAFVADGSRNHRVAVIDMTTGAIKRVWGAYGNKPDDAKLAAYSPSAPPSQQFGVGRVRRGRARTAWSTSATARTTAFRSSRRTARS